MLDNFPLIHEDELLYSLLGRFHRVSGNRNFKETLSELFNLDTILPVVDLPCHLESLAQKLPKGMDLSSNNLIQKYTLFPLYSPFMTDKKRDGLKNIMKHENGNLLKFKMGIIAGSVCQKNALYYCPVCAKAELRQYEEAVIHRTHQIQGVYVCEKHMCILHVYPLHNNSRLEFTILQESNLDFRNLHMKDKQLEMGLTVIAKEVHLLLNESALTGLNIDYIHELYLKELKERGYLTNKGNIRQRDVYTDFSNYYGNTLLAFLESELDEANEYNWLKLITRQQTRAIHPIRHVLLIGFLFGGVKRLLTLHRGNSNAVEPLGLCLNPVCQYFQKPSVTDIRTSTDSKTRETVLTLTCQCGFSYSRKEKGDVFKVGTIKQFGHVWEDTLTEAIHSNGSLRAMAKQMNCDCKTVVKYAEKLGLKHLINSGMTFEENEVKSKVEKIDPYRYQMDVLSLIQHNPTITRQEVRNSLKKQCSWLYRNNREWYEENLPKPQVNKGNNKSMDEHWEKIESEILNLLEKEYDKVMALEKPVRVTLSLLGRRIGQLVCLERKIEKLPKTQFYIGLVTETVEQFQRRRVGVICKGLRDIDEPLVEWKVARIAGLKDLKIVEEMMENYTI